MSVLAKVRTATVAGVDARSVEVETELSNGLPYFSIIGLGDTAVQEARFRVQAALRAANIELPNKRVTINLAPAALRKDGASLDLPMALSLLVAAGHIEPQVLDRTLPIGELALSGALRPVRGVLPIAALARARNLERIVVPVANGGEAAAIGGPVVLAAPSLQTLVAHLKGESSLPPPDLHGGPAPKKASMDLSEVRGQAIPRRALEIAAAGRHNLLLVGNPGSGKTMLARRLPTILPALDRNERIEVTKVWSVAGMTIGQHGLMAERPFRSPHHSISPAGLIGGGTPVRPGEVSLAHRGVLFLDEMPELPRRVLESLRQPMEDGRVLICRARQTLRLPARFMLIGAANPCPCGWHGHSSSRCNCTLEQIQRYGARVSGAVLDRLDMVVPASSLTSEELLDRGEGETSAAVRDRVEEAVARARARQGVTNAELAGRALADHTGLDSKGRGFLRDLIDRFGMSARSVQRTLRVARTIADLEGEHTVSEDTLAEAYRFKRSDQGLLSKN